MTSDTLRATVADWLLFAWLGLLGVCLIGVSVYGGVVADVPTRAEYEAALDDCSDYVGVSYFAGGGSKEVSGDDVGDCESTTYEEYVEHTTRSPFAFPLTLPVAGGSFVLGTAMLGVAGLAYRAGARERSKITHD